MTHRNPADTGGLKKAAAQSIADRNSKRLTDLQERLYAEDCLALLIVWQGVDAVGNENAIELS